MIYDGKIIINFPVTSDVKLSEAEKEAIARHEIVHAYYGTPGIGKTRVIIRLMPWWKQILIALRLPCPGYVQARLKHMDVSDLRGFAFVREQKQR